MWDRIKFVIENLHAIMLAGIIVWTMIILSLQIFGLIDLSIQCGGDKCTKLIEWAIHSASAETLTPTSEPAPMRVIATFLP